ncbi:MAG: hypothetical protein Q8N03_09330 [Ignavibacteria bacterium]|nr:hypothetical protein [Ignavibacteria bacterium]
MLNFINKAKTFYKREETHLILLIITRVLSTLLFFLLPYEFDKYELNLVQEEFNPTTSEFYFFDLDKNDYSNRRVKKYD